MHFPTFAFSTWMRFPESKPVFHDREILLHYIKQVSFPADTVDFPATQSLVRPEENIA